MNNKQKPGVYATIVLLTGLLTLAGCSNNVASSEETAPISNSSGYSSSVSKDNNIGSSAQNGKDDTMEEPIAVITVKDSNVIYTFTIEQQLALVNQLNDALSKYKNGEYPLPVKENTDYAPFAQAWPEGLVYPEQFSSKDLIYTTEGFEMYGIGVRVDFFESHELYVTIYRNNDVSEADSQYWCLSSWEFLKK